MLPAHLGTNISILYTVASILNSVCTYLLLLSNTSSIAIDIQMAARSDDRTPIAMLKPEMYRRRIRGRITKLWTAHSTTDGKKCSHNFIFVDKEVPYRSSKIIISSDVLTTNIFIVVHQFLPKICLPSCI